MTEAAVILAAGTPCASPVTESIDAIPGCSGEVAMPEPKRRKNGSTSTKGKAKKVKEVPAPASQPPLDLSAAIISALSSGPVLNSLTEAVLSRLPQGGSSDLPQGNATQGLPEGEQPTCSRPSPRVGHPVLGDEEEDGPVQAVQRHTVIAVPEPGSRPPVLSMTPRDPASRMLPAEDTGEIDSGDEDTDSDPFDNSPALKGFQLPAVRSAFSRQTGGQQPSSATQELWRQIVVREALAVDALTLQKPALLKADLTIKTYTSQTEAAMFNAPIRNNELPADHKDVEKGKRQRALGAMGHAACSTMDSLDMFIRVATQALESEDMSSLKSALDKLRGDDVKPLGHALRMIAAEYQGLLHERRQLCLQSLKGQEARRALEQRAPSDTHLFGGDLLPVLQAEELRSKMAKTVFNRPQQPFSGGSRFNQPFRTYKDSRESTRGTFDRRRRDQRGFTDSDAPQGHQSYSAGNGQGYSAVNGQSYGTGGNKRAGSYGTGVRPKQWQAKAEKKGRFNQ